MQNQNDDILEQSINTIEEEPKPQYMRLRTSTKELVNRLAESEDKPLDDFMKSLLSFYQLEKTKDLVPGKADIIGELENHLNRIISIVVNLIEHNINIEGTVQEKFKDRLRELEYEIESKESKIEKLKNDKAERTRQRDEYKKELDRELTDHYKLTQMNYKNEELLKEYKEKIAKAEERILDLETREHAIELQLNGLDMDILELIRKFNEVRENKNLLQEENSILVSDLENANADKQLLELKLKEKDIELLGLTGQLDFFKTELNIRDEVIKNLRNSNKQELLEAKKEYKEELQDINVKHKEEMIELNEKHREEIAKLQEEIAKLKLQGVGTNDK